MMFLSPEKAARWSRLLFWGLVVLIVLVSTGSKWTQVRGYSPDMGGFERNVIYGIQNLMAGKGLYHSPTDGAYAFIQYMPLYYHLAAGMGKILGIDPANAHGVYQLARGLNLFLGFLLCLIFYDMARRSLRIAQTPALLASLFLFALFDRLLVNGRPDTLKLFLFTAILWVCLRLPDWRKRQVLLLVSLLLPLAFLTKQDGLIFTGILPLAFFLGKQWKDAFLFFILPLSLSVAGIVLVEYASGGHFLANTVGGLQNGISLSWFLGAFGLYFGWMACLFAPALALAFGFLSEDNLRLRILAAALLCTFFPPLLMSLKFGSGANYFSEATVVSVLILTLVLPGWIARIQLTRPVFLHTLATAWLALFFLIPIFNWSLGWLSQHDGGLEKLYTNQVRVADYMRRHTSGQILVGIHARWRDNLTTLLFDRVVVPCRDVTSQVFQVKKDAVYGTGPSARKPHPNWVVTEEFETPAFGGLDFSDFESDTSLAGYTVWKRKGG